MDKIEQERMEKPKSFNIITSIHGPCWIIGIIFLVLKLTECIDWSWWWITSPLLGCYFVFPIIFLIFQILRMIVIAMIILVSTGMLKVILKFFFSKFLNKFRKNKKHNTIQDYDIDVTPLDEYMNEFKTIEFTNDTIKPKRKRRKKKKRKK